MSKTKFVDLTSSSLKPNKADIFHKFMV